jgi:undecaprenyl-diphosphatase
MFIIEIIKTVLIGIIQGVTEWLPISSTGHMILFNAAWPLDVSPEFWEMFSVVIQLGSILAVAVIYFSKLNPFSKKKSFS